MTFRLSVIIPAYNSSETIAATIQSVLNQIYLPDATEIIVVDDGSTDDTVEIVQNLKFQGNDVEIKLISQMNQGVSAARNTGIKVANGDWIMFLDSDDIWLPQKVQIQMSTVRDNGDIDFLGGNTSPNPTKIPFVGKLKYLHKISPKMLLLKWVPQTSTVLVKKSVLISLGGYDETMRYAEDGDLYLRIAEKFNFFFQQVQLVEYGDGKRMFGESGLSGNLKGMYLGNIKILNKALKRHSISYISYVLFYIWNYVKFLRRIAITRVSEGGEK